MIHAQIVTDSSANMAGCHQVASVPLKIITDTKEYIDDANLNTAAMVWDLQTYTGKSSTACPSPQDWLDAFGDAPCVFCIAITSNLSGSYNAACIAKADYEQAFPDRKVFVIDSLSTGGEMELIAEKIQELMGANLSFEEICEDIKEYQQHTGLVFMLESLNNFAANGRVSPAVAKLAGVLGIRIVGKASDQGTLEPTDKCRGEAKSLSTLVTRLKENGLSKGKVFIAHVSNEQAAVKLKNLICAALPEVTVEIGENRGLCSYYAELGGLLIGYEKM